MKRIFPAILMASLNASAQDTVLLRYSNGQPMLSGPCTLFVNPYAATNLHTAIYFGPLYGGRDVKQAGPFSNHYDFGNGRLEVPDANEASARIFADRELVNLLGLGFACDGAVTLYYSTGQRRAVMNFRGGVPSGLYIEYYPEGTVAARATLDRGMPAGTWTRYYKSGAVYATGTFKAASAMYLLDGWNGLLNRREGENWEEAKGWKPRRAWSAEGLGEKEQDARYALNATLYDFGRLLDAVPTHGIRVGKFSFLTREGGALADVEFDTAGNRAGVWTIWKRPGSVRARLEYSTTGELTHVADTFTAYKRAPVAEYIKSWRERNARIREQLARARQGVVAAPEYGDPMGVDPAMPGTGSAQTSPLPRNYVYTVVDQQPEFQGDIRAYLADKLKPQPGCDGRLVVQFVVQEDGRITDAKILRGLGAACDAEALRVVRGMPKWKPARWNGKPVRAYFNLPIKFNPAK